MGETLKFGAKETVLQYDKSLCDTAKNKLEEPVLQSCEAIDSDWEANKYTGDAVNSMDSHEGTQDNLIKVMVNDNLRSFEDALTGRQQGSKVNQQQIEDERARCLKQPSTPRYKGGNLVVDLNEEKYMRGVDKLKFSVVGKLFLRRGAPTPTTMQLKSKLGESWES